MGMKLWGIKFSQHNQTDNITCHDMKSHKVNGYQIRTVNIQLIIISQISFPDHRSGV